jgi:hypothetical protein
VFINSTAQLDCTPWKELNASGVIKDRLFCASTLTLPNTSSVHLSKGAIIGISIGSVVTVAVIIAGCLAGKTKVDKQVSNFLANLASRTRKDTSDLHGPAELFGKGNIPEIGETSGPGRQELEVLQTDLVHNGSAGAANQQNRNELEAGFMTRGSYAPAELSGWDHYEMPTGAERHEM